MLGVSARTSTVRRVYDDATTMPPRDIDAVETEATSVLS